MCASRRPSACLYYMWGVAYLSITVLSTLLLGWLLGHPFGGWGESADALSMDKELKIRLLSYRDIGNGIVLVLLVFVGFPPFFALFRGSSSRAGSLGDDGTTIPSSLDRGRAARDDSASAEPFRAALRNAVTAQSFIRRWHLHLAGFLSIAVLLEVGLDMRDLHVYIAFPGNAEPYGVTTTVSSIAARTIVLAAVLVVHAVFTCSLLAESDIEQLRRKAVATFRRKRTPVLVSTAITMVFTFTPLIMAIDQGEAVQLAGNVLFFSGFFGRLAVDAFLICPVVARVRERRRLRQRAGVTSSSTPPSQSIGLEGQSSVSRSSAQSSRFLGTQPLGGGSDAVDASASECETPSEGQIVTAGLAFLSERLDTRLLKAYAIVLAAECIHLAFTLSAESATAISSELGDVTMRCFVSIGAPMYIAAAALDALYEVMIAILKALQRAEAHARVHQQKLFLRYVCHEVRVPLNTVALSLSEITDAVLDAKQAAARLTASDPTHDAAAATDLASAHGTIESVSAGMALATASMKHVLDDVLLIEKIRAGRFSLEVQPSSLPDIVDRVTSTFRGQAASEGVELRVDYSAAPSWLWAARASVDPHRLMQVCANLVSNALKFTPPGRAVTVSVQATLGHAVDEASVAESQAEGGSMHSSPQRKVVRAPPPPLAAGCSPHGGGDVSAGESRAFLRFLVQDEGVGMSREDLRRIFKPFTQVKSGKLQAGNGTGLGLAICRQIVELHGGVVGCWSEGEGRGSTFWFDISVELSRSSSPTTTATPTPCPQSDAESPTPKRIAGIHVHSSVSAESRPVVPHLDHLNVVSRARGASTSHRSASAASSAEAVPARSSPRPRNRGPTPPMDRVASNVRTTAHHAFHVAQLPALPGHILSRQQTRLQNSRRSEQSSHLTLQTRGSASMRGPKNSARKFPPVSCMVIDDTRPNALLLARMLQRLGAASVDTAANGLDGLRAMGVTADDAATAATQGRAPADGWRHDVVLMDKEMPVMDGHEATRALRALGFDRPVIGVSGNAMGADRAAFVSAGATEVLDKPVEKEVLIRAVRKHHLRWRRSSVAETKQ